MENMPILVVVSAVALAALAAFVAYRWQKRQRDRGVKEWVVAYLRDHFGGPLDRLTVNCSDDTLWPVLVSFDVPRTRLRHRLQFACPGSPATLSLLSENAATFQGPSC
jgi:hypothetical protein